MFSEIKCVSSKAILIDSVNHYGYVFVMFMIAQCFKVPRFNVLLLYCRYRPSKVKKLGCISPKMVWRDAILYHIFKTSVLEEKQSTNLKLYMGAGWE